MTQSTVAPTWRLGTVIRGTGRSTTRRVLLALSAALLVGTAAVFATSLTVFTRTHEVADTVRTRATPAIEGILAARAALVHADGAAVDSFRGAAALTGPGEDFRVQMAIASQSLTRVAEDNMAGLAGSRDLQLIEGLLVTYTGLMGQGDAQRSGDLLGAVDLWSASRLLHREDSGILAQLDALLAAQQRALDGQLAKSAMPWWETTLVLWLPVIALLTGLLVTHLFFRGRFRRRVNPGLVLAAVLVGALALVSASSLSAQRHLEDTRGVLYGLVAQERERLAAIDGDGQWTLRTLLVDDVCHGTIGCGATTERFFDTVPAPASGQRTEAALAAATRVVAEGNDTANANAGLVPLIYVLAILTATAVVLAFRPRLYEYRYRPR